MHTTRVYVNMKLYEEATGKTELPDTLTEWLVDCARLKEYGLQQKRPIIPIGVRGFDKGTIGQLLSTYNSQLTTDLSDTGSPYGCGVAAGGIFRTSPVFSASPSGQFFCLEGVFGSGNVFSFRTRL